MDELFKEKPEGLLLHERARLRCLPDELSLVEIAELHYPDDPSKQRAMAERLWAATQAGPHIHLAPVRVVLKERSEGEARDCVIGQPNPDPDPPPLKFDLDPYASPPDPDPKDEAFRQSDRVLVEKADYRRWLEAKGWPLPDWWFGADVVIEGQEGAATETNSCGNVSSRKPDPTSARKAKEEKRKQRLDRLRNILADISSGKENIWHIPYSAEAIAWLYQRTWKNDKLPKMPTLKRIIKMELKYSLARSNPAKLEQEKQKLTEIIRKK